MVEMENDIPAKRLLAYSLAVARLVELMTMLGCHASRPVKRMLNSPLSLTVVFMMGRGYARIGPR